jgi:filamentous hemagglutinin family protein
MTVALLVAPLAPSAQAQITPDATLGGESSTVTPAALVQGDLAELIEGGAIRGSNLFHSFLEFNVDLGQRVYFANPARIESILSRVTGGNPSNIFGTLGVDGAADLFLINPNGIVFGENATLDIQGSFYASTAEAIPLGDGVYSATAPEQSSLLTVNPSALFSTYLTEASGNIENRGQLAAQGNMTLAANNLDLQGQVAAGGDLTLLGLDTVQIRDTAAVPFVGFAGGDLLVQGNEAVDIVALSYADSGLYSYGDMVLRSANPVGGDAHYWSGGSFRVEGLAGEVGDLFSPVDPIIRALGDVFIEDYLGSSLHILAGGSVTIGTAEITAPDPGALGIDFLQETITLSDGTIVQIDGAAQPTLDVRAGVAPAAIGLIPPGNVTGLNPAFLLLGFDAANGLTSADITVGDVFVDAPNGLVLLTNQYQPNTALAGGNIVVTGEGIYGDGIDARGFGGQGGAIYLDARSNINVINSFISTTGTGEVGDVVLLANNDISFNTQDNSQTGAFSQLQGNGIGTGGNIRIRSNNLSILNGATLDASIFGTGEGGDIDIEVSGNIVLAGNGRSSIENDVANSAIGNSGDINLRAGSVFLQDGAVISAQTFGQGNSGNINITAEERFHLEGIGDSRFNTLILSRVFGGANGNGGSINISSGSFSMTNNAQIATSVEGVGDAGNIAIEADDTVSLINSTIFTEVSDGAVSGNMGGMGNAGDITIRSRIISLTEGSQLRLDSENEGNAGNAFIFADELLTINGRGPGTGQFRDQIVSSGISSTVEENGVGEGGNIFLFVGSFNMGDGSLLDTRTIGRGNAGDISIEAQNIISLEGADTLIFTEVSDNGRIADGFWRGGDINITANSLSVMNGAQLLATTEALGDAGNINIATKGQIIFDGVGSDGFPSGAFTSVESNAIGRGGDIQISAGTLEVSDGAQLSANTEGIGDAGNVVIQAGNAVVFDGTSADGQLRSAAFSSVEAGATGAGGNVEIAANSLEVLNGAQLTASTSGDGDAGNVVIQARDRVVFDGTSADGQFISGAFSTVESGAEGAGGNVRTSANNISLLNGGRLQTTTTGIGDAGNILIEAESSLNIDGFIARGSRQGVPSVILSANGTGRDVVGTGIGGNITLSAPSMTLTTGVVDARTFNSQPGGDITVKADFLNLFQGGQIVSASNGSGSAGTITIEATEGIQISGFDANFSERLGQSSTSSELINLLQAESNVSVRSFNDGAAGNIVLSTGELTLSDRGQIIAESSTVNGGNITLILRDLLLLRNNSVISTTAGTAQEGGNGGNITITVPFIIAIPAENSDIAADAFEGTGGNVSITARGIFGIEPRSQRTPLSDITASSELGVSGVVTIDSLDTGFIENSLTSLADTIIDTATLTAGSCIARSDESLGSFAITGSGGLPQRPGDSGISSYPTGTVRAAAEPTATLQEPDGVYQLPDGRLVLSRKCE